MNERDLLDRWVLSELHKLVQTVTTAYDAYDVTNATRPIERFVDVLSNWYVRRSRRRFWASGMDADKRGAYATLYECLVTVSHLLAPAMPFLSETLYRNLVAGMDSSKPDSVHLSAWPVANAALVNEALMEEMALVQHLVSVGLAARNAVDMPVRQPLASATFGLRRAAENAMVERYGEVIRDELNVKTVKVMEGGAGVVSYKFSPVFAKLGKRLGKAVPRIKELLQAVSPEQASEWAAALRDGRTITVTLDGEAVVLAADEVDVRQEAQAGYAVAEDRGYAAALDVTLTDDLVSERLAREVVRRVQSMRKDANFDVSDRIEVVYQASPRLVQAVAQFADYIRDETLATSLTPGAANGDYHREAFTFKGDQQEETFTAGVKRV